MARLYKYWIQKTVQKIISSGLVSSVRTEGRDSTVSYKQGDVDAFLLNFWREFIVLEVKKQKVSSLSWSFNLRCIGSFWQSVIQTRETWGNMGELHA
jgi:hypothetical protein